VLRADPGAVSIGSTRVVRGSANVARQAFAFSRLDLEVRQVLVNGGPGTITLRDGRPFSIAAFTIRNGRVAEMNVYADAGLLSRFDLALLG
jgi:RNA polymerase sigma-70 factor (ECF subfamily)